MARSSPAFQFYPAEFLADENVSLTNNQEIGCYIKLLCFCWREGTIPNDVSKIARLCGEPEEVMAQLWLAISKCFDEAENAPQRLVNPRLDIERDKQQKHKKERSESGKKGAMSRWYSDNNSAKVQPMAKPIAEPMAKHGSSTSSSNNNTLLSSFAVFYKIYPKKKGRDAAIKAWKKHGKEIEENFESIIASLKKQILTWKDPQFIPYPATWINGRRWTDEIEPQKIVNSSVINPGWGK
jgi:hypothetical protein